MGILVIALLASYLIYAATHTQTTNPAQLEFHNDFERMDYVMKNIPKDEYMKVCKEGSDKSNKLNIKTNGPHEEDTTCWFDFYTPILTEIGFKSLDLLYEHRSMMLTISRALDDKAIPENKMRTLYLQEQDHFADLLETRVRNNIELGAEQQ